MLTKLAALGRCPSCFSSSLCFQVFIHHSVNSASGYWLFSTALKPPFMWFLCVGANDFYLSTWEIFSLNKEYFHLYGKFQRNFVWTTKSWLTSKHFCCLLGIPYSHRESWWCFGCSLITDGLDLLGGFLDLISYISSGLSPSLGWPKHRHFFFFPQADVIIFFFRWIWLHGAVSCKAFDAKVVSEVVAIMPGKMNKNYLEYANYV